MAMIKLISEKQILPGWGKRDTHAQASNLRYGLDNKIWGVVGYSGYYNGKKGKDSVRIWQTVFTSSIQMAKNLNFLSTTVTIHGDLDFQKSLMYLFQLQIIHTVHSLECQKDILIK